MPLKSTAEQAIFERKIVFRELSQLGQIPTLPRSSIKLLLLLLHRKPTPEILLETVSSNKTVVSEILKMINSGNYGAAGGINSAAEALEDIGAPLFLQAAMAVCVRGLFGAEDEDEWRHAYSCSMLTAKLIEGSESIVNSRLILIMLLHDIGKNMLGIYNRRKYFKARMMAETEQLCAHKAELLVFRVNHAEAGGLLLKRWMLPQSVIRPVFFHHVAAVPTNYKLEVAMTQFVDWIDCMARNDVCMPPCDELMKAARLESVDVDNMVNYQRNLIESLPGDSLVKRKLPIIREIEQEKEDFDVPEEYMEENSDSTQIIRRSRFRA